MPYPPDPTLRASTLDLLGSIWKKLPRGVERARAWGADWLEHSEPFVHVEAGRVLAHVGVMEIEAVLDGRARKLAGIHAVCTHPDRRGQGLLRETMLRALAWIDARYETAVLWANDPAIYTRFGFTPRAESVFRGSARPAAADPLARPLSLDCASDIDLLRAFLARRAPVSSRCGSREPGWLTLINLGLWPAPGPSLVHLPDLDCIVAHDIRDRVLRLHDVIAAEMPALADLTARLGGGFDAAAVFFSPEGLRAPELSPAPTPLVDFLMVRGPFLASDEPFAFSPLTRC
jgi:GNAT superfamily N-acetyltransferase